MPYADRRRNPQYLGEYRQLLREQHEHQLREAGHDLRCAGCGRDDIPLDFVPSRPLGLTYLEMLRRTDTGKIREALGGAALACAGCRYLYRAGAWRPKQ